MNKIKQLLVILSLALISVNASAAEKNFYFGLGYETNSIKGISDKKDATGDYVPLEMGNYSNELKTYFGWNFINGERFSMGLELGYNFGVYTPKDGGLFSNDVGLDLVFGFKIIDEIKFIAQIGGGWIHYGVVGDRSGDPDGINSGYMDTNVGFEFNLSDSIAVRTMLETKYLMNTGDDVDTIAQGVESWFSSIGFSASLQYRF